MKKNLTVAIMGNMRSAALTRISSPAGAQEWVRLLTMAKSPLVRDSMAMCHDSWSQGLLLWASQSATYKREFEQMVDQLLDHATETLSSSTSNTNTTAPPASTNSTNTNPTAPPATAAASASDQMVLAITRLAETTEKNSTVLTQSLKETNQNVDKTNQGLTTLGETVDKTNQTMVKGFSKMKIRMDGQDDRMDGQDDRMDGQQVQINKLEASVKKITKARRRGDLNSSVSDGEVEKISDDSDSDDDDIDDDLDSEPDDTGAGLDFDAMPPENSNNDNSFKDDDESVDTLFKDDDDDSLVNDDEPPPPESGNPFKKVSHKKVAPPPVVTFPNKDVASPLTSPLASPPALSNESGEVAQAEREVPQDQGIREGRMEAVAAPEAASDQYSLESDETLETLNSAGLEVRKEFKEMLQRIDPNHHDIEILDRDIAKAERAQEQRRQAQEQREMEEQERRQRQAQEQRAEAEENSGEERPAQLEQRRVEAEENSGEEDDDSDAGKSFVLFEGPVDKVSITVFENGKSKWKEISRDGHLQLQKCGTALQLVVRDAALNVKLNVGVTKQTLTQRLSRKEKTVLLIGRVEGAVTNYALTVGEQKCRELYDVLEMKKNEWLAEPRMDGQQNATTKKVEESKTADAPSLVAQAPGTLKPGSTNPTTGSLTAVKPSETMGASSTGQTTNATNAPSILELSNNGLTENKRPPATNPFTGETTNTPSTGAFAFTGSNTGSTATSKPPFEVSNTASTATSKPRPNLFAGHENRSMAPTPPENRFALPVPNNRSMAPTMAPVAELEAPFRWATQGGQTRSEALQLAQDSEEAARKAAAMVNTGDASTGGSWIVPFTGSTWKAPF
ncbi:MAG: hypothetical protein SGILL_000996 [Bacillariaceae sp.]